MSGVEDGAVLSHFAARAAMARLYWNEPVSEQDIGRSYTIRLFPIGP